MGTNIDSIKRKLLIKYPTFGSIIANLEFKEEESVGTAATDGKVILYSSKFLNNLSEKEQIFIFAHEVCHVAFNHIYRSEGKDQDIWNIATDSVINALLKSDGLQMIEGGVDIPEAINYDAETMYEKLLKQIKIQHIQLQQAGQKNNAGQSKAGKQENNNQNGNNVGHDKNNIWGKAIEDKKREEKDKNSENKKKGSNNKNNKSQAEKDKDRFAKQGEKETFKENKAERKKRLDEFSKNLASKASGKEESSSAGKKLTDIGIAKPLIDWRKLLRQAVKYDEEWTRKNARMRNGYFRHRIEQIPMPESEIVLDVSGSVSEQLLKNFLRECRHIIDNSKVKVGCFNTKFHGFTEIKRQEDIDNMHFQIGGGTDFDIAVQAFSRRATNKIIFTDGCAQMPKTDVRNVIWVVFGNEKINPKGGRVINIKGEQLKRLYKYEQKEEETSRER